MKETIEAPIFDTLRYSQELKAAGIENSEQCAEALSSALKQNINTKGEVDKMFAAALEKSRRDFEESQRRFDENSRRFDQRTNELKQERFVLEKSMAEDRARHKEEMLEIELRFEKTMSHNLKATITVLGTLIVAVGTLVVFAQHLLTVTQ